MGESALDRDNSVNQDREGLALLIQLSLADKANSPGRFDSLTITTYQSPYF